MIKIIKVSIVCLDCGKRFLVTSLSEVICPVCDSDSLTVAENQTEK